MSISVPVIKRCIGVWGEGVPVVRLALRGPIAISVAARRRRRRASVGVRSGGGPVVEATDVDVRWRHKSCNRLKSRSTFRRCAPRLQYADSDAFPQLAAARRGALAALADAPAEDGTRPTQPRPRYRRPAACRRFFFAATSRYDDNHASVGRVPPSPFTSFFFFSQQKQHHLYLSFLHLIGFIKHLLHTPLQIFFQSKEHKSFKKIKKISEK